MLQLCTGTVHRLGNKEDELMEFQELTSFACMIVKIFCESYQ